MSEVTAAVEACELRKSYRSRTGEVRALDGLSFSAEAGTVFALLGPMPEGRSWPASTCSSGPAGSVRPSAR